ncbi:hypothetical protein Salat_0314800 [Sesamum alatum]|uniref:Uncharacterized protein n=1 Tax=Sesamum alatum TaxID=300844 RepID=A0AAE1Z0A6_9LAMI|nr:hypothetical protein Salat_0314800 [Sesamum alatum]
MGNCIRKGSVEEWGGEDWGSFGSGDKNRNRGDLYGESSMEYSVQKKSLLGENGGVLAAGTEVKIKISKKELERLVKKADAEGMSVQQVLAQLMDVGDRFEAHQRSWRPALQSIPE